MPVMLWIPKYRFGSWQLSFNATRNLEFYNTTTNQNTSNPVYGLYLCRGDVTSKDCKEKIAVIWYDECMIHYPNKPIFSTVIVRPRVALLNMQNITNQDQLNKLVNTSMTSLASKASDVPIYQADMNQKSENKKIGMKNRTTQQLQGVK